MPVHLHTLGLRLNAHLLRTPRHRPLAHESEPTKQHERHQCTQHHRQRHKRANHASNRWAQTTAALRRCGSAVVVGRRRVRRTPTRRVAALVAPLLGRRDCELGELGLEVRPAGRVAVAAKERVRDGCAVIRRRAIVEQEADLQIAVGGELRTSYIRSSEELDNHRASVVDDAGEVGAGLGQVHETEEGEEGGVGAELDAEFLGALAGDGRVQVRQDFAGKLHARDGTHVIRGVVGEAPFVGVGEGAELREGGVGGWGRGAGVVDRGDVENVVDCVECKREHVIERL
jgi:hypothetical protein